MLDSQFLHFQELWSIHSLHGHVARDQFLLVAFVLRAEACFCPQCSQALSWGMWAEALWSHGG